MFKSIKDKVWAFDSEWVPDPEAGKKIYHLPDDTPAQDVLVEMWRHGGATAENPTPFLKTVICKVVSIAAVIRTQSTEGVKVNLLSLPRLDSDNDPGDESYIVGTFLEAIGKYKPQLVGYNSQRSDLKILIQRGLATGVRAKEFCTRPDKPWEGIDYFSKGSEFNIDLMDIVGGWGKSAPSLNEMATVCGIPGKLETDGNQVAELWLNDGIREIIAYNEFDALTTYLLWLRVAYFGGFFTEEQYRTEQDLVLDLLTSEAQKEERSHLSKFINAWGYESISA